MVSQNYYYHVGSLQSCCPEPQKAANTDFCPYLISLD